MDDFLQKYIQKRNFAKTPEPGGVLELIEASAFVVHRHDARNLHFDLRIAHAGRLACWAVPKGFSYDPTVKHLAVHTEDHPIQYLGFEGIIPKGQYGAGAMNIWDTGTYELIREDTIEAALKKGELKLKFFGRKMRGEWHLVKLRSEKDEWLLFKAKDSYGDKRWDTLFSLDLSQQPEADMIEEIIPMTSQSISPVFSDPEWGFEILFEGRRAYCFKNEREIHFRKNNQIFPENEMLTAQFALLQQSAPERVIVDGILVSVDSNGLSSKKILEQTLSGKAPSDNLYYYMLDILHFADYDVRSLPYRIRKSLLTMVFSGNPFILNADYVKENGALFSGEAKKAGVSGVIAKRLDSPYASGESEFWKIIDLADIKMQEEAGAAERSPEKALVKLSNPEKIFFPEINIAKKDLFSYYQDVADMMLPYLRDRPVHLYRFPDGIHGKSFYQKHLPEDAAEYLEVINAKDMGRPEENPYFICNSRSGLLYLINLGTIDLHTWLSRKQSLDNPDWIAWDLDAKQAPFPDAVKIAKEIGKILRGIGLTPFIKTSGKSGLHILVPVSPLYTYEQARMFAESIARIVAGQNQSIASVERNVDMRGGRVYIDFLQNRREATLAAPYSVRPVPDASISMPLEWDELDRNLSPSMFNIKNAVERLSRKADPFQNLITGKQDLYGAIQKLGSYYAKK